MDIINSKGELIMTIEGPIFPRKGVISDYLGYYLTMNDEGFKIPADMFVAEIKKIYDDNF